MCTREEEGGENKKLNKKHNKKTRVESRISGNRLNRIVQAAFFYFIIDNGSCRNSFSTRHNVFFLVKHISTMTSRRAARRLTIQSFRSRFLGGEED